jgi:hypothetical protein
MIASAAAGILCLLLVASAVRDSADASPWSIRTLLLLQLVLGY